LDPDDDNDGVNDEEDIEPLNSAVSRGSYHRGHHRRTR